MKSKMQSLLGMAALISTTTLLPSVAQAKTTSPEPVTVTIHYQHSKMDIKGYKFSNTLYLLGFGDPESVGHFLLTGLNVGFDWYRSQYLTYTYQGTSATAVPDQVRINGQLYINASEASSLLREVGIPNSVVAGKGHSPNWMFTPGT